jgi:hypothetical protein
MRRNKGEGELLLGLGSYLSTNLRSTWNKRVVYVSFLPVSILVFHRRRKIVLNLFILPEN